jgi:hypothetical protein
MVNIYCLKENSPRILVSLVDRYSEISGKKYYNRKNIYDKVNKKENNICILNVEPDNVLWEHEYPYWREIEWALDNGLKVFLDYSWENINLNTNDNSHMFHHKHKKYILNNNIKIISQCWDSCIDEDYDPDLRDSIINFSLFEFNMRLNHELENQNFRFLSSPTKNKKYLVNYIPGDIRKHNSALALQILFENLNEDDIFYSTIIGDYFQPNAMTWDMDDGYLPDLLCHIKITHKFAHEVFLRAYENKHKLIQHRPFESYYNLGDGIPTTSTERRIPPGVYESCFSLVQEVAYQNHFYTEKTFKHVIAEQPFLIIGATGSNHGIKNLGYEIFEEVFDYSYDKHCRNDWKIKGQCLEGIRDNINILKDNRDLFDQKSVREKTTHNRHNLLQRTNIDMFEKELERVLTS